MKVTTLLALLAAVAAVVGVIAVVHTGWFSPSDAADGGQPVVDISKADIAEIIVARKDRRPLRLIRAADQWRTTSPLWGPADPTQARRALDAVADLRIARRYAVDDPKRPKLAATGLLKSTMKLAVVDVRGERREIVFGTHPDLIRQVYAQIDGGEEICLIGPDPTPILGAAAGTFRHKRLLEFKPERLTRLIFAGRANYELTRRGGRWRISSAGAVHIPADEAKVAALIDRLTNLEIASVTPTVTDDLKAFGLEPAALVVVLMLERQPGELAPSPPNDPSGPEAVEVAFGSREGDIFVMLEGDRRLLRIAPAAFGSLIAPAETLRDRRVWPFQAGRIAAIELSAANRPPLTVTRRGDQWTTPDGDAADGRLAETLTALIADRYITRYASLTGYGLERPAARLAITDADGATRTLLVGACDGEGTTGYLKWADDQAVMTLSGERLGRFLDTLAAATGEAAEAPAP